MKRHSNIEITDKWLKFCWENLIQIVSGRAFASLIGGQLIAQLQWNIPSLLKITALLGFTGGLLYLALYHIVGKHQELKLVQKLDFLYPDRTPKLNDSKIKNDMAMQQKDINSIKSILWIDNFYKNSYVQIQLLRIGQSAIWVCFWKILPHFEPKRAGSWLSPPYAPHSKFMQKNVIITHLENSCKIILSMAAPTKLWKNTSYSDKYVAVLLK